ncbi:hypothetical protein [Paraclostridium sordellii]|uniref:hypothetical protein n=1 Tax=Paraclostridium sordellii TaxID=1505 RepID=UPI0005E78F6D|nr:hypothetical protein [Paeniclostridium sordellii]CEN80911.1 Uncharacterised protein [[Clostridium] sordellii] [Paeniclostridium sordellii]
MIKQKNLYMANFNCTFGEENNPFLHYFEEIVRPAFFGGYEQATSKNTYFFHDVKLLQYKPEKYAISGIVVKKTQLEVKSLIDDETGNIIKKDDKIPSDPFSYFILFLENHRMVLVKNQSGSPNLKNFESLARHNLKEASIDYCRDIKTAISVNLNVGSLPSEQRVDEELDKLAVINQMVLKLYPLNGDIDNVYGGLREELAKLGSPEGYSVTKSPKNMKNVKETLIEGKGMFTATLKGRGINGEKISINNDSVAATIPIYIDEDGSINENISTVLHEAEQREELKEISEDNKNIYVRFLDKMKERFRHR